MNMNGARRRVYQLVFEDSDEEVITRRPRWIKERINHFDDLDETDFKIRFRLSKQTVLNILRDIEDRLEFAMDKNDSISPVNQLLCALRFYATGCYLSTAADLAGCSSTSAHRIVHKVSNAIASLLPKYITFPNTPQAIRSTQLGFYNKARFPKVVGAIDCTHVRLRKSPGGDHAEIFRNRKGYFSLNVQAICNSKLEFLDIVARWPGSTHDAHIFNNCRRRAKFEDGSYGDAVLVGDAGYACTRYMMTPLEVCITPAQHLYNEAQIRTRNSVERMFGIWKRRFPAMALGLGVNVENSMGIIVATAVLHNIAQRAGEEDPLDDPTLMIPAPWVDVLAQGNIPVINNNHHHQPRGQSQRNPNHAARLALVEEYFANLAHQEMQRRGQCGTHSLS